MFFKIKITPQSYILAKKYAREKIKMENFFTYAKIYIPNNQIIKNIFGKLLTLKRQFVFSKN